MLLLYVVKLRQMWVMTLRSVHLHLFSACLCLLASLCVRLPVGSLLGSRDVVRSAALVVSLWCFFHSWFRPVDHRVTHALQFLVRQGKKASAKVNVRDHES